MSFDPKLEIFKLRLTGKGELDGRRIRFRDFFRSKINVSPPPVEREDVFTAFFRDFIKSIDLPEYKKHDKRSKGFVLAKTQSGNSMVKNTPGEEIFDCVLKGGLYNRTRILGDVTNTQNSTPVKNHNIISDLFYVLVHTPLDSHEGIIMIQSYQEARITDIVKKHIQDYFKINKKVSSKMEYFIPEHLKDKFMSGAKIKGYSFTTGWNYKDDLDEDREKEFELQIKVEISDMNPTTNHSYLKKFLSKIAGSQITIDDDTRSLDEFRNKKAKIQSKDGKTIPINLDSGEIRPTLLLKDVGVEIWDQGGNPVFAKVNEYCRNLLSQIIEETEPDAAKII